MTAQAFDITKWPLTPHLVCNGAADAIAFYKAAFGAEEMMRLPGKDGKIMHACVLVNGAPVMLVDENPCFGALSPKALNGTPVTLHVKVADVDAFVNRAVEAGASIVMPVEDMFWGDRYGIVEDPFGHRWGVATPRPVPMSETELKAAAAAVGM